MRDSHRSLRLGGSNAGIFPEGLPMTRQRSRAPSCGWAHRSFISLTEAFSDAGTFHALKHVCSR
jgi:hypothetical protein